MASSGGLHVVDATHVLTLFASHAPALVVPLFTKARELVTPDARMWLVAMKGSGDARKVLSLFDEFCAAHAAPSKHVLTLVLRAAVATRRFRVVEQVLALIAKFRVPVDLPLANALLGCATNARDGPALVKQVLDLMEVCVAKDFWLSLSFGCSFLCSVEKWPTTRPHSISGCYCTHACVNLTKVWHSLRKCSLAAYRQVRPPTRHCTRARVHAATPMLHGACFNRRWATALRPITAFMPLSSRACGTELSAQTSMHAGATL